MTQHSATVSTCIRRGGKADGPVRRRELAVALSLPLRKRQQLGFWQQAAVAEGPQTAPVSAPPKQVLQLQVTARTTHGG